MSISTSTASRSSFRPYSKSIAPTSRSPSYAATGTRVLCGPGTRSELAIAAWLASNGTSRSAIAPARSTAYQESKVLSSAGSISRTVITR